MSLKIRLAIVDHNTLLCESLSAYFEAHADFDLLWSAESVRRALYPWTIQAPDVLLLDVETAGIEGFDLLRRTQLTQSGQTPAAIVILSDDQRDSSLELAAKLGVQGYLLKTESLDGIVDALRRVAQGEPSWSDSIALRLRFDDQTNQYEVAHRSLISRLTPRQTEILEHLAKGESAKEIARRLHLSAKSVNSHTYRIMKRLDVHDRVELTLLAVREGLVVP